AVIYHGIEGLELEHQDNSGENMADQATQEKTVKDVVESMTEEQQNVLYYLVGEAVSNNEDDDNDDNDDSAKHSAIDIDALEKGVADKIITHMEENKNMRNVFDQSANQGATTERPHLTHSQVRTIVEDAVKMGSFKESF